MDSLDILDYILITLTAIHVTLIAGSIAGFWQLHFCKFKLGTYNRYDGKVNKIIYMGFISVWVYK